jgi:CspA family cold shock protein
MIYQVKWFQRKKSYGFCVDETGEEVFVHYSDIKVDGYKYLKMGEYIAGDIQTMDNGKKKLANIHAPMTGGKLMCEIERDMHKRSKELKMEEA